MGMGLHVREGVKCMIFILNLNPSSLSFLESWSFNKFALDPCCYDLSRPESSILILNIFQHFLLL